MNNNVLITGASGLLGQDLVEVFRKADFHVFAHYFSRPGSAKDAHWLFGDFSTLAGIREFLDHHRQEIKTCRYLVNNYGPITYKYLSDLKAEDFLSDFHQNVIPALEIIRFMIRESGLKSVVNIGFEHTGKVRSYKKVLSYAIAKNSLFFLTLSMAEEYKNIRFNMVSPTTLAGAEVPGLGNRPVDGREVACRVLGILTGEKSGTNEVIR